MTRILVCDDLDGDNQEFTNAIWEARQPGMEVKRVSGKDLAEAITDLIDDAEKVFAGDRCPGEVRSDRFNGDVDLLVLDNNLAHLGIRGARLTAEAIAGYIRAFSPVPYVVSVNKNPNVDFDLRYLVGDYASRADLALNVQHLSNPGLWDRKRSDAQGGFLPWYWPKLLGAAERRRGQVAFVAEALGESVCASLGISSEAFSSLSRHSRSLLSQAEEATDEPGNGEYLSGYGATFRQVFMASSRSIPNQDERKQLLERFDRGDAGFQDVVARVVAADIDFWFRRDVLGPQELLVDVPHLLTRMPFVLGRNAGELRHWNSAVDACTADPPYGMDPEIFGEYLRPHLFEHDLWAQAPCFWWAPLKENDELNARFTAEDVHWAEVVFCEDRSEFLSRQTSSVEDEPVEFVAQFEGAWSRRYVANLSEVHYAPKSRFAL